jgi:hypothetical protein
LIAASTFAVIDLPDRGGDDQDASQSGRSSASPSTSSPSRPTSPQPSATAPPSPTGAGLGEPSRRCHQLIRATTENPPNQVKGEVMIDNSLGTTIVVSAGERSWTCNLRPDPNVSRPKLAPSPMSNGGPDYSIAEMVWPQTGKVETGLIWGGGPMTPGVESMDFLVPDGSTVRVVSKNGFWVVQALVREWHCAGVDKNGQLVQVCPYGSQARLRLRVNAAFNGGIVTFRDDDLCNQVLHGC